MTFASRATWIVTLTFSIQTFAAIPKHPIQIEDPNPNVRVHLKGLKTDSIEVIGSQIRIGDREIKQNSIEISRENDSWSVKAGDETLEFAGDKLPITGQSLFIDKVFVPPSIALQSSKGAIDLVANLPLETYLEGVVAAEIPSSWPHEAQKAQAITARTFTLNKLKERRNLAFDVEATVMDQMFKYRKFESLSSSQKAVRETRGAFIANSVGIVEPVFYHASCGGATDGADKVFGQPVSRQAKGNSVKDGCALNTKTLWQAQISEEELEQKLKPALHLSADDSIFDIRAEQLSVGGRVVRLAFNTTNGKGSLTGEMLRSLVGYTRIKSTKFSVAKKGDRFVFVGRGLGHGVGLCQWGARELALKGKSAKEILQYYFPYLQVQTRTL